MLFLFRAAGFVESWRDWWVRSLVGRVCGDVGVVVDGFCFGEVMIECRSSKFDNDYL